MLAAQAVERATRVYQGILPMVEPFLPVVDERVMYWTWARMVERTEVEYGNAEEEKESEPEADGGEGERAGGEGAQGCQAEAAWRVSHEADEGP